MSITGEREHLPGVQILYSDVIMDRRGYSYNIWNNKIVDFHPVMHFSSFSYHNVLRGLHFQEPISQAKLIYVFSEYDLITDVVVSLETGEWEKFTLTLGNALYVPKGYAHGFYVKSPTATVHYLMDDFYSEQYYQSINPFDPYIGIDWGIGVYPKDVIMSNRDRYAQSFLEYKNK